MRRLGFSHRTAAALGLALLALAAALPTGAAAQGLGAPGGPRWALTEVAWPTNFTAAEANDAYVIAATNVGGEATNPGEPVQLEVELPAKTTFVEARSSFTLSVAPAGTCGAAGQTVTCELEAGRQVKPGEQLQARIVVDVAEDASGTLVGTAGVEGGGAAPQQARVETPVGVGQAAPGIAPGSFFSSVSTEQAGAHPNATAGFTLSTTRHREAGGNEVIEPSSLKTVRVETPPGLIGAANAAPKCIFLLFSTGSCPADTKIGVETIIINTAGGGFTPGSPPLLNGLTLPLYNMETPAGVPAEFATAILSVVIVLKAEVRSGGDYGLTITAGPNSQGGSIIASSTTFFGNPSQYNGGDTPQPFVYNPTSCGPPQPSLLSASFYQTPSSPLSQATSAPQGWTGCDQVPFAPSLTARPTTSVADSPSGLDVDVHIPQSADPEALASSDLRDAAVTLPEGVAINPSAASGLGACTPAQVELHGPKPAQCPDSAKVGSVEIDSPLLDHPIPGGIYVAKPGDNPFGSLLAIYVAAHDPTSGIVVKLAGKVEADPGSGRLTTRFSDNPQLPFEDFKLSFFGGSRAVLTTPLACGAHSTSGTLAPWSGTAPQAVGDSFSIDTAAAAGPCPGDEGAAPNRPEFEAGTTATSAGAYAPFVLHLRRGDGSQRLRQLNATLPPGLLAKLAGVPYCPEAAIAAAAGNSAGAELAAPSCPAASEVGRVTVAAGAGPSPFYLDSGRAYLAGPYKGAPLSLVIVTPALAGPYDLGTVAVRAALRVDPRTAA
ncbi:MAG: hypothetical protein JST31_14715, partial [Actinobacteria bacterium]|nr:hypothetical protein [Actinomycetota bacterium]